MGLIGKVIALNAAWDVHQTKKATQTSTRLQRQQNAMMAAQMQMQIAAQQQQQAIEATYRDWYQREMEYRHWCETYGFPYLPPEQRQLPQ